MAFCTLKGYSHPLRHQNAVHCVLASEARLAGEICICLSLSLQLLWGFGSQLCCFSFTPQLLCLWFSLCSHSYWAIALFGEFKASIRILKGSFPVARFLFLPMSYAWFPPTEDPLKSVEAQLKEGYTALWGGWWGSQNAASSFRLVCDLTAKNNMISRKGCIWWV